MLKINLGSGNKKYEGFLNLDKFKYFKPDIVHDLEIVPYPFKDDEVEEIRMIHILEHIGKDSDTFINIMKEIYRICCNNAKIEIVVPHPRNDDFLADPTHVRPITTLGLQLYDKDLNIEWKKAGAANSQLALRQEKFIRDLKTALIRIENKTYGLCRVTGKLISKKRLKLVPHATLSIEAKNIQK